MTLPHDYNTHAGSIRKSAGILQNSNQRSKKVSAKQVAAEKISNYFSNLVPLKGMTAGLPVSYRSSQGFINVDNKETGVNAGDGKLTAKTWNGIMKKLGISGFRIKNSISSEEYEAFLKKYEI